MTAACPRTSSSSARRFENAPQGISDYDFVFGYKGSDGWVEGSLQSDPRSRSTSGSTPPSGRSCRSASASRARRAHACAYVIADEPIANFIPLTSVGADQITVTQFTAPSVEAVGRAEDGLPRHQQPQRHRGGHQADPEARRLEGRGHGHRQREGARPRDRAAQRQALLDLEAPRGPGGLPRLLRGQDRDRVPVQHPGAVGWLRNFDYVKETREDGTVVKALDSIEALSAFTALDRPGPLDYFVETADGRHNMLVEFATRARGGQRTGSLPILDQLCPRPTASSSTRSSSSACTRSSGRPRRSRRTSSASTSRRRRWRR
jgi:hypothetical protein